MSNYCVETKLEADAELIRTALFLAFNLLYQPAATRAAVGGGQEIDACVSSALAFQIVPNVVVGVDLWYLRHYQGVAFNSLTGDAVYLGPTFFWKIAPKVLMSAAWEARSPAARSARQRRARPDGFSPPAGDIADRIRILRRADDARGPGG